MKFTTIHLGENNVELFNSLVGIETVKVNGETVSSKFSITGTQHHFKLLEQDEESEYVLITGIGLTGVVIDLYKNNKPIIESPKIGCLGILLLIIVVAVLFFLLEILISRLI